MGHKRGATYKANCVSKPDNFIVDRQTNKRHGRGVGILKKKKLTHTQKIITRIHGHIYIVMTFAFCLCFISLCTFLQICLLTVALHVCFLSRSTFFCVVFFLSCHVMRALYEARIKIKCWNNKKGKCVWMSRSELLYISNV